MAIKENSYNYQNICPYCYPDKPNHRAEKINSFFYWVMKPLILLGKALTLHHDLYATERYLFLCIKLMHKNNHIQMCKEIIRSKTITRLQLIWDEAQKRGLDLYIFRKQGLQLHSYLLRYQGREYYFNYTPTTLLYRYLKYKNPRTYDHKGQFKKILQKNNLPTPQGKSFCTKKRALQFASTLGYPLVIKPESSTLAHHVSTNINDEQSLSRAFDIAKMIDFKIIVEKYIEGEAHRVICIGDKFIACAKRMKASIIGDGHSTIGELIEQFNRHPYRGKPNQTGSAIYQVDKHSSFTTECLRNQNVNLQTIIKKHKIIYLSHKSTCGTGAEVINVTDDVCPENIQIFLKVHHILKIGVSGVDFICDDVSKPWHTQNWVFLENNSLPSIDLHHYPSIGNSINVAKEIWDFILQELKVS
ncbi:hypothetical protein [Legionella geestiana]|uniref:ATP-binding protein n=1 Tax=Legionella geestiana TaxID=45065 RepID=UPI00138F6957|nr:hypothetical protein [Legionella geestiana]